MEEINKLSTSICDLSYQEGLEEIIKNLKTINIDTFAMNDTTLARLAGQEEMLQLIIKYLERCL